MVDRKLLKNLIKEYTLKKQMRKEKRDFLKWEEVRKSGVNMLDIPEVCYRTKLDRDTVIDMLHKSTELKKKYIVKERKITKKEWRKFWGKASDLVPVTTDNSNYRM